MHEIDIHQSRLLPGIGSKAACFDTVEAQCTGHPVGLSSVEGDQQSFAGIHKLYSRLISIPCGRQRLPV